MYQEMTAVKDQVVVSLTNKVNKGVIVTSSCQTSVLIPSLNSFHPKISVDILLTVLDVFPKVLTRRICLTIKRFYV